MNEALGSGPKEMGVHEKIEAIKQNFIQKINEDKFINQETYKICNLRIESLGAEFVEGNDMLDNARISGNIADITINIVSRRRRIRGQFGQPPTYFYHPVEALVNGHRISLEDAEKIIKKFEKIAQIQTEEAEEIDKVILKDNDDVKALLAMETKR